MNSFLDQWGHLIARIALSALFIISGAGMLMSFSGTVAFIGSLVPMASIATAIIIAVKVLGGIALLVGWRAREAAWALIGFTVLTIFFAHSNLADQMQLTQALKNLSIIGGLLMVVIHGAGNKTISGSSVTPVM
jgi:putative oxidoreductase